MITVNFNDGKDTKISKKQSRTLPPALLSTTNSNEKASHCKIEG